VVKNINNPMIMKNLNKNLTAKQIPGTGLVSKIILMLLIGLATLVSCKKSRPIGPEQSSIDRTPVLKASATDLQLNEGDFNNMAVNFTWSPGSNHGTNSAVDYTLQFGLKGNDFAKPTNVKLGRNIYSQQYTVADFNDLLLNQVSLAPDTSAELEVRIKSAPADSSESPDFSNAVNVKVKTYKPVSSTLYLIGDATPNGWDANNATPLKRDENNPTIFHYKGALYAGQFKFITDIGQFVPSYNMGSDSTRLFYRTDFSQPDNQFTVNSAGNYKITVDLYKLTINIVKLAGPPYSQLWIVGDATPNGWDIGNAAEMRRDPGDHFIFQYNEILNSGEFKIATKKDFNAPFYRPTMNHPDISSTAVQLNAGDPDNKWYITNPGAYKITLNLHDTTISIKPFTPYTKLWIVGDATPNGWNIDNPNQMQLDPNNPYIFTYDGPLTAGEFKFPTATGDWGTDFFMPAINHQPLDSTTVVFTPGGSPDKKWQITTAGNYSITLNQLYETIKVVKN